jgi:hypothetical protein
MTIESCEIEKVGMEEDEKPVLRFKGCSQGLPLNRTNFETLIRLFGSSQSESWIGKRIELFRDESVSFGGTQGGVRIREAPQVPF